MAARTGERNAGIKSDKRLTYDIGMVLSERMETRIGNNQGLIAMNRILAERNVAIGFGRTHPDP